MSQIGRFREFVSRNIVSVVTIPSLFVMHWGWLRLQSVDALIKPEERKSLPIVEGAKVLEAKLEKQIEAWKISREENSANAAK